MYTVSAYFGSEFENYLFIMNASYRLFHSHVWVMISYWLDEVNRNLVDMCLFV